MAQGKILLGILALVVLGGFFVFSTSSSDAAPVTGNAIAAGSGGTQEVVIGMKNYDYSPQTIRVKAGQPVSLSLDSSVQGCFRDFTIRELGVRKYLITPQDTVTFTPEKPGQYTFACSMGMGSGTLIVE